ncbi:MAG: putative Histidine kinase [Gemmatimonadetes bacterium]|nr:putative Histidine kinase [Gemmatimonadota bacterium]
MTPSTTLAVDAMDDDSVKHLFEQLTATNNELAVLHRDLTRKTRDLEEARTLNNQFLGMAAHDLRNPLHVIGGMSRVLLRSRNVSEMERKLIQSIFDSSDFMRRLVDDLLQVSELDAGMLRLHREPCALRELVAERVELQRPMAEGKGIAITLRCLEPLPPVNGDRMRLAQVLDNLLSNAIKYSRPGTRVTVTTRATRGGTRVSVGDEGQGIARDELGKLFLPFGVTSSHATGGEKSTGLGLLIVKRIAEAHGGSVLVRSRVGVGTTFHLLLPAGE